MHLGPLWTCMPQQSIGPPEAAKQLSLARIAQADMWSTLLYRMEFILRGPFSERHISPRQLGLVGCSAQKRMSLWRGKRLLLLPARMAQVHGHSAHSCAFSSDL